MNNDPVMGFYRYPIEFLIGEFFPNGTCIAEFLLIQTYIGFKAEIYDDAFNLIRNPKLKKLWDKPNSICTMQEMENYLINMGLTKLDLN